MVERGQGEGPVSGGTGPGGGASEWWAVPINPAPNTPTHTHTHTCTHTHTHKSSVPK